MNVLFRFPRAFFSLQGKDRISFLHNLVSHDIKGLQPGQGRLACLLDRQGKIQAVCFVHAESEELVLETDPEHLRPLSEGLQKYQVSESVEFQPWKETPAVLSLHGPGATEILTRCWPGIRVPEKNLEHAAGPAESRIDRIVRWDLLGGTGLHLWVHHSFQQSVREKLISLGKSLNLQEISAGDLERMRIEAGVPWPEKEITETVILNELNREEWVSFTKGCFVGQEIVARIKHRAWPPRLLTGFFAEGNQPVAERSPIRQGETEVGLITSSCLSPTLNRVIALGYLKHGTLPNNLQATSPQGRVTLTVTPLPFVR